MNDLLWYMTEAVWWGYGSGYHYGNGDGYGSSGPNVLATANMVGGINGYGMGATQGDAGTASY